MQAALPDCTMLKSECVVVTHYPPSAAALVQTELHLSNKTKTKCLTVDPARSESMQHDVLQQG